MLPSLNLAEEINRIVQARLLVSPLAATTDIEITDDLSGGIRIRVNGVPYASPDDVPDPDVKALAVDYLGELLLDLAVDLSELQGVRRSAVQGVGDLLRRVRDRDVPTSDEVDALGDFDWYFSQP